MLNDNIDQNFDKYEVLFYRAIIYNRIHTVINIEPFLPLDFYDTGKRNVGDL